MTTKRILIGTFLDGNKGIRVSLPGYDVTSNPVDNTQLSFNSDWLGLLPVYLQGNFSMTGTGLAQSASASFTSLGYVPYIYATCYFSLASFAGGDYVCNGSSVLIALPVSGYQDLTFALGGAGGGMAGISELTPMFQISITATTFTLAAATYFNSGSTLTLYYTIFYLRAI